MSTVGILHPGAMGAAVGAALVGAGHEVVWCSERRSAETAERARAAGLTDARTLAELTARAEVILSICPPHAALETAARVSGFEGVYVDANAIAPQTAREVGARLLAQGGGARFVDGGIIGPPPERPGTTRLYLSGEDAPSLAALFAATPLEAVVVSGDIGAASALKMAYAAWTKGTAALLVAIDEMARADDVRDELLAEWARSQPDLAERSAQARRGAAEKGWRWQHEMLEIAATFEQAGQPPGFHQAAAEVFAATPRAARPSSS